MRNKLVSIIIPAYNVEAYVDRCLDSVIRQTYDSLEIICIDDSSTDATLEKLEQWKQKDMRVRCVKNESNLGLSRTRNKGMEIAKGEYIFFLDADDYLELNCIEILVTTSDKNKTDMLGYSFKTEFENSNIAEKYNTMIADGREIELTDGKDYFIQDVDSKTVHCMSVSYLYRTEFIRNNNLQFETGIIHEDMLFYFQCLMHAERVKLISEALYHYCMRERSIVTSEKNLLYLQNELESYCVIVHRILEYPIGEEWSVLEKKIQRYARFMMQFIHELEERIQSEFGCKINRYKFLETKVVLSLLHFSEMQFKKTRILTGHQIGYIKKFGEVIIYGNGKIAKLIKAQLVLEGVENIFFATSQGNETDCTKINQWIEKKDAIVVIGSSRFSEEMEKILLELGCSNYIKPIFEA